VAKAEHRIEECLKRGKSEAGLADYQVRNRSGWHHHQAPSLIALWFLVQEAWRGKKEGPALTVSQVRAGLATIYRQACRCDARPRSARERMRRLERNELARLYHYKSRNQLPLLKKRQRDRARQ
jgi:hypothetical protein